MGLLTRTPVWDSCIKLPALYKKYGTLYRKYVLKFKHGVYVPALYKKYGTLYRKYELQLKHAKFIIQQIKLSNCYVLILNSYLRYKVPYFI